MHLLFILIIPIFTYYLVRQHKKEYKSLPQSRTYAGFWNRFVATAIDVIIVYFVAFLLGYFLSVTSGEPIENYIGNINDYNTLLTPVSIVELVFLWLYVVLQQASKHQATIGMRVVGYKIYDETLDKPSFWRLTGRYFSTSLSFVIFCIGFLMIGWTKRKQGLHDIIGRTLNIMN